MKNSADLEGFYPPRPWASVDNTLLDLQNSSYPTQPYSIIAKYVSIDLIFLPSIHLSTIKKSYNIFLPGVMKTGSAKLNFFV